VVVLPVDARGLAAIAERVFTDVGEEPDVDHLDLDLPSVQDAILSIQDRMTVAVESDFENLVAHCERSVDVVAYFLGLLELSRWGILQVTQEDWLSPIHIRYNDDAARSNFDALVRGEEPS
jgi:segregation and condensation protein A